MYDLCLCSSRTRYPPGQDYINKMRILLLADSHGRELGEIMTTMSPHMTVESLWMPGGKIKDVKDMIVGNKDWIIHYNPTYVIFHTLHNQLAWHARSNPTVEHFEEVVQELEEVIKILIDLVPLAVPFVSGLFPRIASKYMAEDKVKGYNTKAQRVGRYIVQRCHYFLYVRELWLQPYKGTANPDCFNKRDGLHFCYFGKREVARNWVEHITKFNAYFPNRK